MSCPPCLTPRAVIALGLLCALVPAGPARADGAFPDASRVLLRPDRPGEILVTTNFGLLVSTDDGRSFRVLCEEAITSGIVSQYTLGPPPGGALFATGRGLHRSDDGCRFAQAQGSIAELTPTDVWPDPTDASHVFALGFAAAPGNRYVSSLFPSRDGGRRFGAPLFEASGTDYLTSVENARSAPGTVYAVLYSQVEKKSSILHSSDDGLRFGVFDTAASVGPTLLRIAAVDPAAPRRLYLRAEDPGGTDRLIVSDDGGETLRVALTLSDRMTALLRREDGTVLVGAADGSAFRSRDGGRSFSPWPGTPHLRGLGERGGRLYAVTDPARDGYALAVSDDDGASFRALLRFDQLCGPLECVALACKVPWDVLAATLRITPPDTCFSSPPPPDLAVTPAPVDAALVPPVAPPSGCGCRLATGTQPPSPSGLALLLVLSGGLVRRRRRGGDGRVGACQPLM